MAVRSLVAAVIAITACGTGREEDWAPCSAPRGRPPPVQTVATCVNRAAEAQGQRGVMTNRKRVSSWESAETPRVDTLR